VTYAPQSSPALRWLPVALLALQLLPSAPLRAQEQATTATDAPLTKSPGDQTLGTLAKGAQVAVGQRQGDYAEVTVEGWIYTSSVTPVSREGYDLVVSARRGENLRLVAGGALVARLQGGALLRKLEANGAWTRVSRTAWVSARVLEGGSPAAASADTGIGTGQRVEVLKGTPLLQAAEGPPMGTLVPGSSGRVVARSGDWVRIQVTGWVRDSAIKESESSVLVGVSQAEVQADPARYVGQVVEWRIQFLALQKADELRPEIPNGAPYLLARGPLPEAGFVYVIIPQAEVARFSSLPPLQELTIRAKVRAPSTKYLSNAVVERVSIEQGGGGH
jgi:hypothetical protein